MRKFQYQRKTINDASAAEQLAKKEKVAQEYIDNPEKLRKLIEEGTKKANSIKGPLDEFANTLKVLFSLTRDWMNGSYRVVPAGSIIVVIAALIYFLSPVDLIPDILPIVGLSDDVVVVALAYKQVKSDIEKYKVWKGIE